MTADEQQFVEKLATLTGLMDKHNIPYEINGLGVEIDFDEVPMDVLEAFHEEIALLPDDD